MATRNIIAITQRLFRKQNTQDNLSPYSLARNVVQFKVELRDLAEDIFLILLGVLSAGFGLRGFLLPNHFLDGGATGIALLISIISPINIAIILMLVNAPFILIGYRIIDKAFALKTACAIVALALAITFLPYPEITNDKLLVAVFGGFFLGLGIGLSVRGGAVIDGSEVLAIAISRKTELSIGDVILLINVLIFASAAWLVSIETALYAMLTYLAASKTVDFIIEGIEEYTGVTIISVKSDKIIDTIHKKMGRGITVYKGESGHGKSGQKFYDMKIIYTIVTRLEVNKLKLEIEKIDPNAFVVMSSEKDMKGGMIKKRRLQNS